MYVETFLKVLAGGTKKIKIKKENVNYEEICMYCMWICS